MLNQKQNHVYGDPQGCAGPLGHADVPLGSRSIALLRIFMYNGPVRKKTELQVLERQSRN